MDATFLYESSPKRRLLTLAGLASVPLYLLPVSIFGRRALWPRALRQVTTGALVLGALSLLGLSLRRRSRPRVSVRIHGERWKLPIHGAIMPEEFAASAASCR